MNIFISMKFSDLNKVIYSEGGRTTISGLHKSDLPYQVDPPGKLKVMLEQEAPCDGIALLSLCAHNPVEKIFSNNIKLVQFIMCTSSN